jgi:hypothetical protein
VSDVLVHSVDQTFCERQRSRISGLSCQFPQISRTVLYTIITVRLGYHKIYARWVPKIPTRVPKNAKNGFGFDFF